MFSKNGWYFTKREDGSVKVAYTGSPACTHALELTKAEWEALLKDTQTPTVPLTTRPSSAKSKPAPKPTAAKPVMPTSKTKPVEVKNEGTK